MMLEEHGGNECEGLLTETECLESLKSMESNKSPGRDGLPAEFYRVIWKGINHYLLKCIKLCICKRPSISYSTKRILKPHFYQGRTSRPIS